LFAIQHSRLTSMRSN